MLIPVITLRINHVKGFIKIERKLSEHWIFQDAEKLKWWLILLLEVNYLPGKIMIGNNLIEIEKGQSAKSLRSWAKLLNTGTKSVVSFFEIQWCSPSSLHLNPMIPLSTCALKMSSPGSIPGL